MTPFTKDRKDKVQKIPNSVLNVQNKQKSISRKLIRSEADPDISIRGFQNNLFWEISRYQGVIQSENYTTW